MTKVFIINEATAERIPFLRGVLVQSLVTAGLPFQDAYPLAQMIRKELGDGGDISLTELRSRVTKELKDRFGKDVARAFEFGSAGERQTTVVTPSGRKPFSVGILTRSLEACAIRTRQALETARKIRGELSNENCREIDHLAMRRVVYQNLKQHCSEEAANRFLSWRQFKDSGKPLIILLGGITGTGKSTVATEMAYRLNVVRTQSTDMVREIARGYLAPAQVPTLAFSSFEAWKGLPFNRPLLSQKPSDSQLIVGFESQFEVVRKGLEATIARAAKERLDLIVDGIHVLPSRLDLEAVELDAVVVSATLVIATKEILGQRLKGRGLEQPGRAASRYLQHLEEIWKLQSYLIGLAEQGDIPLIFNWVIEDTILETLVLVSQRISAAFPPDPGSLA